MQNVKWCGLLWINLYMIKSWLGQDLDKKCRFSTRGLGT